MDTSKLEKVDSYRVYNLYEVDSYNGFQRGFGSFATRELAEKARELISNRDRYGIIRYEGRAYDVIEELVDVASSDLEIDSNLYQQDNLPRPIATDIEGVLCAIATEIIEDDDNA